MPDVKIAGGADLTSTLQALASLRPVFHSEADFQMAFAWQVKVHDPQVEVYLETRPAEGVHLDVAFERRDLGAYTAIELKYLTRAWIGTIAGQHYELKNHGAQDVRAYDVVKDICRVEEFTAKRPGASGAVIVITNDRGHWVGHTFISPVCKSGHELPHLVPVAGQLTTDACWPLSAAGLVNATDFSYAVTTAALLTPIFPAFGGETEPAAGCHAGYFSTTATGPTLAPGSTASTRRRPAT